MAALLRDKRVLDLDVLAIQEPWRNPYVETTHHPAKDRFHLCYPSLGDQHVARVCFFINKRLDHTQWQFEAHTKDLCTLSLKIQDTNIDSRLHIHNLYNPNDDRRSTLRQLRQIVARNAGAEQIILGDFNLHHELWGGEAVGQADSEARELLELIEDYDLTSTLEPGTVTYEEGNRQSTIDLCLVTFGLVDRLIRSEVDRHFDHDSDHLPIVTSLNLDPIQLNQQARRKWKGLDEKALIARLKLELPPLRRPRTKAALDRYVQELVAALQIAAEEATPLQRPSARARPGWNDACAEALAQAKRLRRAHSLHHTEETWEAYCSARNHKGRVIKKALREQHRKRVEQASESPEQLWKMAKWARNRERQPPVTTPSLRDPATGEDVVEPDKKATLFKDTFFPIPPNADLDDIRNHEYGEQIDTPPITEQEVVDTIQSAAAFKAPGPDGIIKKVLKVACPRIKAHLARVFNQSLYLGYCPQHFRQSTTIVLRKPGKDNYTVPKAYRPIALLNTIGKIMDSIIAKRLSYLAETLGLLPDTHMGGRKLKSTKHALHYILDKIYEAWSDRGKVASLLLLDVSGAFDNVSHERLLHNLRKRKIDEKIVRWIASSLQERYTSIIVDGYTSETYRLTTGIPQGSNYSPILYLFYNADLIDSCNELEDTAATGFIDDVAILAWGTSTEQTCEMLGHALGRAMRWAASHASIFAPEKFQLTHFTRARTQFDTQQALRTPWGVVPSKATCKYLGLVMDTTLTWKSHIDTIQRKASKTISALSSLGNSAWGLRLNDMRKIYTSVVIPQITYACSAWSNVNWRTRGTPYTKSTHAKLESLQARAARAISGAFRATSIPALEVETHLLPIAQQIWKHNLEALIRLGPSKPRQQTARQKISPHIAIEQSLRDRQGPHLEGQEQIPPYIVPPWWEGPRTYIDENADKAITRCRETQASLNIYTDGSGINGHVGAAAVCITTGETRSTYMGGESMSTVYAAEIQGIILALQIANDTMPAHPEFAKLSIWTDNQAAIRSAAKPKGKSGAYLLRLLSQYIDELQRRGIRVEIRWIPSHKGIRGNEAADKAAKEATGWRDDNSTGPRARALTGLQALRTTIKTWIHKTVYKDWQTRWETETRGRTTFRHTQRPTRKTLQLHEGLTKRQSSMLIQLRTEKIGLRDFLFNRRVSNVVDPRCDCGEGRQTVAHILLRCRRFKDLRRQILGPFQGNLRKILSERKSAIKAIEFMERTQILGQSRIETNQTMSGTGGRL